MAKSKPQKSSPPSRPARRKAEADADAVDAAYTETCRSLLFHPSVDVEEGTVCVLLDIPPETESLLLDSPVVTERLRALRQRLGPEIAIEVGIESLADDADEAWHRLRVALVQEARQPELFSACERLRRRH